MSDIKQKIPNATTSLVLGIISIPTCMCYGIVGLICGFLAIRMASSGQKAYNLNPEEYDESSLGNLKTGKITGIIGMILSVIYLFFTIVLFVMLGSDAFNQDELMRILQELQQR